MNSKKLGIIFVLLFILVFGLISLPKFTFNLGDNTVNFDYVDRALNKFNIQLGNFRRSFGIYPTKEVKATLGFEVSDEDINNDSKRELLYKYSSLIEDRLNFSNLSDVKIRSEISENEYRIIFEYPDYYTDELQYTRWLTSRGDITFQSSSQENPRQLNLRDYNIVGNISVDYLDQVGSHLVYKFRNEDVSELNASFAENQQGRYFYMNIDGIPSYFVIEYDQYIDTNQEAVRALPTNIVEFNNLKIKNDYLNITRSYFQDEPFNHSFTVASESTVIPAVYKSESLSVIGLSFILSILFISTLYLQRYGVKRFFIYSLMLLSFITMQTALLKIFSANLSISLVVGYVFTLIFAVSLVWYLLNQNDDIIRRDITRIRDTSIFIFIVVALVTRVVPSMGIYSDFVGLLLVTSLTLFILSILNFKILTNITFNNFSLPRFKFTRK